MNRLRGCRATTPLAVVVLVAATGAKDLAAASPAPAPTPSPEGLWATVDDRSGSERALVRIALVGGQLVGTIERIRLRPDERPDPVCAKCRGERQGARIVGMNILWGHRPESDRWVDGRILDPENGREYSSSVWLADGETLRVRGHWGPFHRTQTWHRRNADGAAGAANPTGGAH
jgi:uncharacterized protein (DUF2147 family)